jgi:molybdenum cofactor cytidylyltransferase
MNAYPALGVIILGAGASSRMGRAKLLLPWGDTTVIGQIIRQWRELGAGQITVVLRPNDTALNTELNFLNLPKSDRIENPQPERGMFSSVLCAANWGGWKEEITSRAIALGDQPHLRLEMLQGLLLFHSDHPDAVCLPEFGGHGRHPVLLPPKAFEALRHTKANTLKDFLKLIPCPTVQYPTNDIGLSLDVDTPEDYKEVLIHFSAHEKS